MSRHLIIAVVALAACGDNTQPDNAFCDSWHQWGNDPSHSGQSCVAGQPLGRQLASVVIDPFTAEEVADSTGDLVIHYQAPLIDGDAVFMSSKGGTYTSCERVKDPMTGTLTVPDCFESDELYRLNSETWTESRYEWHGDQLVPMWTFTSDWKPEPGHYFEPVFQPALVDNFIAIPGEGGSVWELDATTGAVVRYIAPFQTNPDVYVAGALAVHQGSVYYNAIHLDHNNPAREAADAWLVAIAPDGDTRIASYADLVPGAPAGDATCSYPYTAQMYMQGYPPIDADGNVLPAPTGNCGRQMPGLNAAPAFAPNGTMFVATHAQYDEYYSYLVSIDSDSLTTNWATSLRGLVADGCDVTTLCTAGAGKGIDPTTGQMPAMLVDDDSSASPVALADGGVLYGAYSTYNAGRGHLLHLDAKGGLISTFDFGWDSTPAVLPDGSIIEKDNHYGTTEQGQDEGPYYVTKLNAQLQPVWRFTSTETQSCTRAPDGTITCVDDHPNGFEWCINAPAVDRDGVSYLNSEDGHLYAIDGDGNFIGWYFLGEAIGAAYTPVALDHLGRIYAINAGHLIVVGL